MNDANESRALMRSLLSRPGSYSIFADLTASGRLPRFPMRLLPHVGDVYRRVETAAYDFERVAELRLAALVHEEPLERVSELIDAAGVGDFSPTVTAVIREFGRVWKVRGEAELCELVECNRTDLAAILLFELAHEGQPIPQMERAAELGGLRSPFACWAARLSEAARVETSGGGAA
jgi:hypothetical protein